MFEKAIRHVFEKAIRHVFANGRGVGVTESLHAGASWPVVVLFALLAQLGDVWFYFLVGGALYVAGAYTPRWGLDRRRGLSVLGLLFTYVSLVGVLKGVFRLERPPGATVPPDLTGVPTALHGVFTSITTASGSGFPSGHALGATLFWGGLALLLDRGSFRTRAAVAGTLVTVISVSRLVLGVHYLVDVVAGVLLGLVVLVAVYWLSDAGTRPGRILGVAVVVGLVGLFPPVSFDGVAAVGAAVGGWVAWRRVAVDVRPHPSSRRAALIGFAVVCAAGALFVLVYTVRPSLPLTFLGAALATGAVVGAPLVAERVV